MIRFPLAVLLLVLVVFSLASAQGQDSSTADEAVSFDEGSIVPAQQYVTRTFEEGGKQIDEVIVPGRPPKDYRAPVASVPASNQALGINVLTEVPAFDWSYGCSATAAAMMMGYYDRHGYPNMYAGPTNGGVCPLNNSVWGHAYYPGVTCGECPLSATKQGIDGRATRGHVNDYWIDAGNAGPDPYMTGGWLQHTWDCTADFMGTNQSSYGSFDGSTTFYYWPDGRPLCDYDATSSGKIDGCYGMARFAESRGYTVLNNCSQYIYGHNGNTLGFTFAQYCAEIDAGRPVLIQVFGHTMLGYGYNTTGNVVYIHDTWDYYDHTMTWGGSYHGMQHYGVTTFQLAPAVLAIVTDVNSVSVPEGGTSDFGVKLSNMPSGNVTVSVSRISGDSDITVQSGSSLTFNTINWDSYQYVTLAAAQDSDAIDGTATIRCSIDALTTNDITATEADDDSMTVSQMKMLKDGSLVGCSAAAVTAVFGDSFYIEDDDRSCGIRVHSAGHSLAPPMRAKIAGAMQTGPDGERFIEATYAAQNGMGTAIKPLGLVNRAIGGGDWMYNGSTGAGQRCVLGGAGLNNIGLLVRTNGRVKDRQDVSSSRISFWNFDANPGWTFEGQWAWGRPTGSGGYYGYDPTSGFTGSNVVGYNLSGDYPNNMTSTLYARTPAINCSGYRSVKLRFYRWLGVESASFDSANIQVSSDGVNWTDVWVHTGPSFCDTSWSFREYDISLVADDQPAVYLRWGMGPTDASVTYPGWNIDDVEVVGTGNSYCTIDDGSGVDLKVLIPSGVSVPAIDSWIRVTGISSCESDGTNLHPVLKVRGVGDID